VGVAADGDLHRRAGVERLDRLDRLIDLTLFVADALDLVLNRLLFLL
jgi:hypothetical protein